MQIIFLIIAGIAFIAWIFLILWDNYEYYNWQIKIDRAKRKAKAALKKRLKEFKWPDDLPHIDL